MRCHLCLWKKQQRLTCSMNCPEISIITVTFGRLNVLRRKLESLTAQTLAPERFELVLCVNDDPETLEFMEDITLPFALTLLPFSERLDVTRARNACVRKAQGELLYLSDDDALLYPETLERHLTLHQAQAKATVVVGGIDFEQDGMVEAVRPARVNYWNLNGVNTSLPKPAFEAAGGFPEWLTGYGLEDVLLGYALKKEGCTFAALPNVGVRHLGANPMRGLQPDKARSAGRNAVRVVKRYPELAFRLGVHPLSLGIKRLALSPLVGRIWKRLDEGSFHYERAYLEGALEEKRLMRRQH